jgi:hypothetical protein
VSVFYQIGTEESTGRGADGSHETDEASINTRKAQEHEFRIGCVGVSLFGGVADCLHGEPDLIFHPGRGHDGDSLGGHDIYSTRVDSVQCSSQARAHAMQRSIAL